MSCPWLPELDGVSLAAVAVGPTAHKDAPELDRLPSTATPTRRATFVAGRRAARAALERRWGSLPDGLRVDTDGAGCPVVRVNGRPRATRVSISHTAGWAVAAAAETPLGLDLVEIEAFGTGFAEEAFTPEELAGASSCFADLNDGRAPICLAFAAKEAALKWLGVGMRVPLTSVRVGFEAKLGGELPGRVPVQMEHPNGRVRLSLAIWPLTDVLWCALLM